MPKHNGFTLVELILALTLGVILAGMIAPMLGTSLMRSAEPLHDVRDNFEVAQVIDNLTAEYRNQLENGTMDLGNFDNDLSSFEANGVSLTGTFLDYRSSGSLSSTPSTSGSETNVLLVKATKGDLEASILFTD